MFFPVVLLTGVARFLFTPLALAVVFAMLTSYLLSLAVFIPMSGWTADRFGARTVFRAAIAVFVLGSIGCAASSTQTRGRAGSKAATVL